MSNDNPGTERCRTFLYRGTIAITYRIQGNGPLPLVFLHGFAAARTTWDDLAPLFPADRYTLYLIDLKGFGDSAKPHDGRYAVEDQAEMVTALLDELQLQQVVLIGHSLGGGIALLVSIMAHKGGRPGLVARLVIIDGAAYPQPLPRFMRRLATPLIGWCILHMLPVRFLVTVTLASVYFRSETITEMHIQRYARFYDQPGVSYVMRQTVRQLVPERYGAFAAAYPRLTMPALLIWGEHDRIIRCQIGERLQRELPDSRLLLLPECGHNPHEEEPQRVYAAISDFLSHDDHTSRPAAS